MFIRAWKLLLAGGLKESTVIEIKFYVECALICLAILPYSNDFPFKLFSEIKLFSLQGRLKLPEGETEIHLPKEEEREIDTFSSSTFVIIII